jgi:DNA segregation ATPase FtsK/SpoIIIE-like protein
LVEDLRKVVHEFAGREEKLNSDLRVRVNAENRTFAAATASHDSRVAGESVAMESAHEAALLGRHARFEQRRNRIHKAHLNSRNRATQRIEDGEGRAKYELQKQSIEAERKRDAALAGATTALDEYYRRLGETRETFILLEKRAQTAFGGYGAFLKMLASDMGTTASPAGTDHRKMLEDLERLHGRAGASLDRFGKLLAPRLFRIVPIWAMTLALAAIVAATVQFQARLGLSGITWPAAGAAFVVVLVVLMAVYLLGKRRASLAAMETATHLAMARHLHNGGLECSAAWHQQEKQRIEDEFKATTRAQDQTWKQAVKNALDQQHVLSRSIDEKSVRIYARNEQQSQQRIEQLERQHVAAVERFQREAADQKQAIATSHESRLARIHAEIQDLWQAMEKEWKDTTQPICDTVQSVNTAARELAPDWNLPGWRDWKPPEQFLNATKFGRIDVDLKLLVDAMPGDSRLSLNCSNPFSLPLFLTCPGQGSILFETTKTGGDEVVAAMNNIIFRTLSITPPGKAGFTIIDPAGLGQNFAGIMHLADYEESHINSRIWTQTVQIEERLAELNEHMEKVIQMYLRNEFATIAEYNAQAGVTAEKLHYLVIAGFPRGFSDTALRRLINIASSGARCGVYLLIHWDRRQALPPDFVPDELYKNCFCLTATEQGLVHAGRRLPGTRIVLDTPPPPETATDFLHKVGKFGKDSNRIEVPFEWIAPREQDYWTGDNTEELRVPIGRSGASKLQMLAIGKGTRQHVLIAGKTGSGKSTLFHVIITNLALWCSPDQVEFYLVDFKKGVEFKCYGARQLPHARVVAIESDRQFGLSVLQRVDEELKRRGDLFRKFGAQDLSGYKRAGGTEPLPRSLLIIDEFQEFFVEEDRISQNAAVLLDRIVRQGRAFGIHVLLGSQTLGGAYTLARATIGQMVIRIALQCNEADAYLIMDDNNPAPRLLSRPGEGIYNDMAGSIEGNNPFQTVWLSDEERDQRLAVVQEIARRNHDSHPGPIVFEGNAAADVAANPLLRSVLATVPREAPVAVQAWIGAPNSIKDPTGAVFRRQSGSSLLIVGQREEATLAMLTTILVSLAAQHPVGTARFILLDSTAPGAPEHAGLDRLVKLIPHDLVLARAGDVPDIMARLDEDLKQRGGEGTGSTPSVYFLIHGLQNFKKLRNDDDFSFSVGGGESGPNPAAIFQTVITEGPSRGVHVITTFDTYSNVNRFLGRKALGEFEMRVLFQMSASDSASLIDSPEASGLGLQRALFYNDREGYTETFRPYAPPDNAWIEEAGRSLAARRQ